MITGIRSPRPVNSFVAGAPNPPHGAVFTVYLANVPKPPAEARRDRERETAKAGEDVPFPGWDALRDEALAGEARYYVEFGGQFEHMIRARGRLMIIVPAALVLIFTTLCDLRKCDRHCACLHGYPVRMDRGNHRIVVARYAIFHIGRDRFRRSFGRGGPR